MRYSTVIFPAALLLVAVSAAAATQSAPQPPTPGTRVPSLPPVASAPSNPDTIAYPATLVSETGVPARQQKEEEDPDNDVALAGITAGVLVPLVFFTFFGGVFYLAHRHKTAVLKARQETQTRVLDQLLAREDLSGYLTTPAGRRLLESVMEPGDARRSTAANRIIGAVGAGAVLLTMGLGFFILSPIVGLAGKGLWFFKVVPTIVGAGFLISAGATYLLSKRFGLIETPGTRD